MRITIELLNQRYHVNPLLSRSIAIPVNFIKTQQSSGHIALDSDEIKGYNSILINQPNHFSANAATSSPMQAGGFIGDTEQGGSCNVNELRINPHCNGTHTETIAHICDSSSQLSLKIADISPPPLMPCVLISICPESVAVTESQSQEHYQPTLLADDKIISRKALERALCDYPEEKLQCVVIRTLPNHQNKCRQVYDEKHQPAFFSTEAIGYLNERGVEHLVVDIPSLDRLHDDGLLTCHHLFWQVPQGTHQASNESLLHKTITELAYIDNESADGFYFINLQIPAFINDAAPSRPILYQAQLITND